LGAGSDRFLRVTRNLVFSLVKDSDARYHTPRSAALIGYTMFANLAQIIIANLDNFSDLFLD